MNRFRMSSTARILILVVSALIILNGVTGYILIIVTRDTIKEQIQNRMLDVSNSAAASIDGDIYEKIQAEDKGTPEYEQILKGLSVYRDNIELKYIYGIRDNGNNNFIYTIDPDLENPAEFGEPVVFTEALQQASLGVSSVVEVPYTNEWGKFYSSYSPIKNSSGEVVGIIAVDFDATWFEKAIYRNIKIIVVSSIVSLLVGTMIVIIVTSRMRNKIRILDEHIYEAEEKINELAVQNKLKSLVEEDDIHKRYPRGIILYFRDELDVMSDHIISLLTKLQRYTEYIIDHSYIDGMTGLENKKAYIKKVREMNEKISNISQRKSQLELQSESQSSVDELIFSILVFNVKGVGALNKKYGYEAGDIAIKKASKALAKAFPREIGSLYHLNGGEYAVVIEKELEGSIEGIYNLVEEHLRSQNEKINKGERESDYDIIVKLTKGEATYDSSKDRTFGDVFHRAEQDMLENKGNNQTIYPN